jgi:hypothetical protein
MEHNLSALRIILICAIQATHSYNLKSKVPFFSIASLTDLFVTRMSFTPSDRYTGMTLGKSAAPAATFDKSQRTKLAFSCTRFVVHPSALQPYEGLLTPIRGWRYYIDPEGMKGLVVHFGRGQRRR